MLLQTNSYIVPKEKRAEHARLMRRFRQVLNRLGCDNFEVYEQVGANWSNTQTSGRFVQIMRFRDRKHQLAVQGAERTDPAAQELIAEFCDLVNYPYQQQQGQFAVGFYSSVLPVAPLRPARRPGEVAPADQPEPPAEAAFFGAAIPEADAPAEAEANDFAAGVSDAAPADESAADPDLLTDDLTEAEQEAAADAFAQDSELEQQQGGQGESASAATESAEPTASYETTPLDIDEPEADAPLPSLDVDDEPQPEAERTEPTDLTPGFVNAEPAEPQPEEPAAAEANGEFDHLLDDLNSTDEVEMTDDDLARLAQELSADQPPQGGNGGTPDGPKNGR